MPPVNRPNLFRPADYKPGAPIQRSLMGKNPLWPPVYRPGAAVVPVPLSAVPAAPIQPRFVGAPIQPRPMGTNPLWPPVYRPGAAVAPTPLSAVPAAPIQPRFVGVSGIAQMQKKKKGKGGGAPRTGKQEKKPGRKAVKANERAALEKDEKKKEEQAKA